MFFHGLLLLRYASMGDEAYQGLGNEKSVRERILIIRILYEDDHRLCDFIVASHGSVSIPFLSTAVATANAR